MSNNNEMQEQHQPTARFIQNQEGPRGDQKLWQVNDGSYLLTSSIDNPTIARWVRETLLFPANSDGEITDFEEIEAVYQPDAHEEVLRLAGYKVEVRPLLPRITLRPFWAVQVYVDGEWQMLVGPRARATQAELAPWFSTREKAEEFAKTTDIFDAVRIVGKWVSAPEVVE